MTDERPKLFELFSEARIALMRECTKHEDLVVLLSQYPSTEEAWPEIIGELAAYVGVIMDGMYTVQELENLYPILFNKLRQKAMIIVVPAIPAPAPAPIKH